MSKVKSDVVVFIIFFGLLLVVNGLLIGSGHLSFNAKGFGIMVAAGCTLGLYSFLYKDNPIYKMTEHFYVGVATAYTFVVTWYTAILPEIIKGLGDLFTQDLTGAVFFKIIVIIIPTILGMLIYTRLIPKISWLSRITFAILFGYGAGLAIPNLINANILKQAQATMITMWTPAGGVEWGALVIFVGVIATLIYFFFSLEHKGAIGGVAKVGIWFLMVSFGASFGYTVMARIALLVGRVNFLFGDWIPLIK